MINANFKWEREGSKGPRIPTMVTVGNNLSPPPPIRSLLKLFWVSLVYNL